MIKISDNIKKGNNEGTMFLIHRFREYSMVEKINIFFNSIIISIVRQDKIMNIFINFFFIVSQ